MKVSYLEFTRAESAAIYTLAGATCKDMGMNRKEAMAYIGGLTPQNIIRLALGLSIRTRGGKRPNNGRRNCARCERVWSEKVKALGEGLCQECWHAQADAKSATI